ncbi:DUF1189 domain-containing protein [Alteribacter aurantiacus]|uniref:DUF1189 domain-containing protein n=1 Tax=Alteribacter aurantiacus TaxID=254410 RepID=UPI0003F56305|nr:DUF1189 domain-containing protein [Alteribacter aurantiacus]
MNIFKQFAASLYSPSTVATFRQNKIGRAIGYVFLLMFITLLPLAISLGTTIYSFVNQLESQLEESVPDFHIQNGVLTSNETNEPVINEEDGQTIIFDPTGEITPDDVSGNYNEAIALLEREAILITNGVTQQPVSYQDLDLNLTKSQTVEMVETFSGMLPLIIGLIIVLMYIFYTASKFIGVTFLALIGYLFRKTVGLPNMQYKHSWVLSAFAVTLPTTLFALLNFVGLNIPFQFALYWTIAIVFLFQVLRYIPKPRVKPAE